MKFISFCFKNLFAAVPRLLVVTGLTFIFTGCQWGDQIEAIVQPNPDNFTALFSDTSSVRLSTVATDSFMTGSASRILVGRYTDPFFGKMHAAGFIQPGFPQNGINIPERAVYDSLVLSLRYDGYYYGDTTIAMNVSVHALQEDMLTKSAYYNDDSTPYDPAPIGTVRFRPTPRPRASTQSDAQAAAGRTYLKIKLSNTLGKNIFDKGKASQITNSAEWINLLKGLVLMPSSTDNGSVTGFQTGSTALRLYYHIPAEVEGISKDSVSFDLAALYNQTIGDRRQTVLNKLPTTHRVSLPSSQSGNMSFVQAGTGIMTRIDLPSVRQLRYIDYTFANKANLVIEPLRNSTSNFFTAPAVLYVYLCDRNNDYVTSNGVPIPLTGLSNQQIVGQLVTDLINNRQYYTIDLSKYVSDVIRSESDIAYGLLLRTSDFATGQLTFPDLNTEFSKSFNRLVIGDQVNPNGFVKLQVYYTTVRAQ